MTNADQPIFLTMRSIIGITVSICDQSPFANRAAPGAFVSKFTNSSALINSGMS